jgi:hypothetical protein
MWIETRNPPRHPSTKRQENLEATMRNPTLKQLGISLDSYRALVQTSMAAHRRELLERRSSWIQQFEAEALRHFTSGSEVDIDRIQPRLELVTSRLQHALWRYCRLWGSIPYNRGCGRLLRYLLRDDGQPGAPVMGVMALSSPVLICKPRDAWIGWQYPADVALKRRYLLSCMDLSVSMAVPPYNHLTAGKMICLAMLSNEVRADYREKFEHAETPTGMREGRLALITTTSLYGSSVQYNRIRVDGRTAYQLVGYTAGFGNSHITERAFAEMETYLVDHGAAVPKGWGTGRSYRLRVLTAYARRHDGAEQFSPHEHQRSVYVAPLANNAQAFLQGQDEQLNSYALPFEALAQQWRERWLRTRLTNPETLSRFRTADPRAQLLSHELEC